MTTKHNIAVNIN